MGKQITLRFGWGDEVRDLVTGFTGVVTGFTTFITGCDQYLVNPPTGEDGKYVAGTWLDDVRLEATGIVKATVQTAPDARLKGAAPEGAPR